jgi:hypothetical protein
MFSNQGDEQTIAQPGGLSRFIHSVDDDHGCIGWRKLIERLEQFQRAGCRPTHAGGNGVGNLVGVLAARIDRDYSARCRQLLCCLVGKRASGGGGEQLFAPRGIGQHHGERQ